MPLFLLYNKPKPEALPIRRSLTYRLRKTIRRIKRRYLWTLLVPMLSLTSGCASLPTGQSQNPAQAKIATDSLIVPSYSADQFRAAIGDSHSCGPAAKRMLWDYEAILTGNVK